MSKAWIYVGAVLTSAYFVNLAAAEIIELQSREHDYPEMKSEIQELDKKFGLKWTMFSRIIEDTVHWDEPDVWGLWEPVGAKGYDWCYSKFRVLSAFGRYGFGIDPFTRNTQQFVVWVGKNGSVTNQRRSSIRLEISEIALPKGTNKGAVTAFCAEQARQNNMPLFIQQSYPHAEPSTGWNHIPTEGGSLQIDHQVVFPRNPGNPFD